MSAQDDTPADDAVTAPEPAMDSRGKTVVTEEFEYDSSDPKMLVKKTTTTEYFGNS